MKHVLLIGGTGMLGANLAHRLVANGFQVSLLARPASNRTRLESIAGDLRFLDGDVTDKAAVCKAVEKAAPHIVFHLAATPFNPPTIAPEEHFRVNALGTLYLLEALRKAPRTTLVYTGSAAVYGADSSFTEDQPLKPATILGAAKAAAATLLQTYSRMYGLPTVELRLFMPYGPWEHPRRLVPQTILAALDGRDLPMSLGEQQRDLVYVEDVIEALILAGTKPLPPESVINIGSGVGTPVKDVVRLILSLTGTTARALLGALPTRPDEIMVMAANIDKARQVLNWKPRTTLEQGLEKTIAWVKANRALLHRLAG